MQSNLLTTIVHSNPVLQLRSEKRSETRKHILGNGVKGASNLESEHEV